MPTRHTRAGKKDVSAEKKSKGKSSGKEDFIRVARRREKAKNEENLRKFEKNKGVIVDKK